jgi:hypothetical protein
MQIKSFLQIYAMYRHANIYISLCLLVSPFKIQFLKQIKLTSEYNCNWRLEERIGFVIAMFEWILKASDS